MSTPHKTGTSRASLPYSDQTTKSATQPTSLCLRSSTSPHYLATLYVRDSARWYSLTAITLRLNIRVYRL
ncbi:hypothetical protein E2C01_076293 [Portunus trituberculatus]|uniref:Uncharacterized protein n=1 Tax=Portunus trituberculatus TaxID=210409 RepID=A0A5B7IHH3_PORTR|nr:hypothetical protein [Portunus trituberculatus]